MTPLARRLTIALVISVALNLLIVGFAVGRGLKRGHRGPRHADRIALGAPELGLRRHPAVRSVLADKRDDLANRRKVVMEARTRVAETLAREPFDRAAADKALLDLRGETTRSQELVHRALVDAAQKESPQARRELAAAFERSKRP